MSENVFHFIGRTADGTVNAKRFGKITAAGKLAECNTAGESADGIIGGALGTSISDGVRATLECDGFPLEVECSGTVTAGEFVQTDTTGKAVSQTSGKANGRALTTATNAIVEIQPLFRKTSHQTFSFPITLAQITGAADVVTNWTPGFAGTIQSVAFIVTTPVTTAAKAASLNLEIGTTNLTGGVVALTSANSTPLGATVAGSAITAANRFSATDTISVESSAVTAFLEGAGVLQVVVATP